MERIKKNPLFLPLILITAYCVISYFLLIPKLGFYSEDVFASYIWHFFGQNGIIAMTSTDRPAHGVILNLLFGILGVNILYWHLYTFFIRLLGGFFLFFLIQKLWPNRIRINTIITILFLVYPGFLQQTLPLGYGIWITTLTLWILSMLLTTQAVFLLKQNRKLLFFTFLIPSLALEAYTLTLLEFFIGLELIRIILIFYILNQSKKISFNIKIALPYFLISLSFLFWRIFIFKSTRDVTDINYVAQNFYLNPLWVAKLPIEIIHSFFQAVIFAYFIPIAINFIRLPIEDSILALIIGICSGFLIYIYINKISENSSELKKFGKQLFFIGIIFVIIALIPIIAAGRIVRVYLVYDRYTISSMVGIAFIITGFIFYKFKPKLRNIFLCIILSISVSSQLMNGFFRVHNWEKQKDIWWQLYWRSPQIEDNAMLILYFPEISKPGFFKDFNNQIQWNRLYWVDYQIWRLGNLFFNYTKPFDNQFNGDFLSDQKTLQKIYNGTFETINDSNLIYSRYFNNSIILATPGDSSCLWVFDKNIKEYPQFKNQLLQDNIKYSDETKLIKQNGESNPPIGIFGLEPQKKWCYYFQKASLARQQKNWIKLSNLTTEVFTENLKPDDINEWLPFLEGYIVLEKYNQANNLLKWISQNYPSSDIFNSNLCEMSERLDVTKIIGKYCQKK